MFNKFQSSYTLFPEILFRENLYFKYKVKLIWITSIISILLMSNLESLLNQFCTFLSSSVVFKLTLLTGVANYILGAICKKAKSNCNFKKPILQICPEFWLCFDPLFFYAINPKSYYKKGNFTS